MLKFVKIRGDSLCPEYQDGDYVLISKLFRIVRKNDVVVFWNADYGMMIKRVQAVSNDGFLFFVTGSHPASLDSRHFGWISRPEIGGRVLYHIRKRREKVSYSTSSGHVMQCAPPFPTNSS